MYVTDGTQAYATNQAEFEEAVRAFDPTAKVIKWLDK